MYLSIDCEMGGVGPQFSLLQVGAIFYSDDFREVDKLDLKVKPDDGVYKVSAEGLKVNKINLINHDITALTYTDAGKILGQKLYKYCTENKSLLKIVGLNVGGDIRQITTHLISPKTWENFVSHREIDVSAIHGLFLAAGLYEGKVNGSLCSLLTQFKIPHLSSSLHNAVYDAECTFTVYVEMVRRIQALKDKADGLKSDGPNQ